VNYFEFSFSFTL